MRNSFSALATMTCLKTSFIILIVVFPLVMAEEVEFHVDSFELMVYRDGLVHVVQTLTMNETFPAVNVALLAPAVENVIAVDENNALLDYETKELNITVFCLGTRKAVIEYDTTLLTKKEAGVWTLIINATYSFIVKLPEDSTVMYLNEIPQTISTEGDRTILQLPLGYWEVSYVLPTIPVTSLSPKPHGTPSSLPTYFFIGSVILAGVGVFFFLRKRRGSLGAERILKKHSGLRTEDEEVIQFLALKGGKVLEAEIRERFPELPRTSVWRLVKRLEKKEIVNVKRVGLQNQIELKNW